VNYRIRTITLAALGVVGLAAIQLTAAAAAGAAPPETFEPGAVFAQTDNPAGNQIIAYRRAADGTLTYAASYYTGGKGAVAAGAVVDPLASQGSLTSADHGRLLLAVNAGTDTVSVFRVAGTRLTLREVVGSGGAFPASIAVHDSLVYVLDAGGPGGIEGYRLVADRLWPIAGSHRSLHLTNTNPPAFLQSPGQVGFTPDGSQLIVTTKASNSDIDVFTVARDGRLSAHPVINPSATPVPFAFSFDPTGRLVVAEAAASDVSTYRLHNDGTLTTLGSTPDGQAALCWITRARGHDYVSNAGSANLSEYTVNPTGQPTLVGIAADTQAGTTDSATAENGRLLYVENGGAGTIDGFRVARNGTLTPVGIVSGLPIPSEGLVAL
jgi:6-phosphogluconolactonase (cycloisomerase 2 family)